MIEQNILAAGRDTLLFIREQVLELDGCKARVEELIQREEKQERTLAIREKQVSEEIIDTVKKRKEEIAVAYNKEEEELRTRQKKLKAKKEKSKNGKKSERIEAETSGLAEENNHLKREARSIFKQAHAPHILNTSFYYGLFMPKNVHDFLICLITFVVLFVAVPTGVYLLLPEQKAWYLILIYLAAILLFGGFYVLIYNYTKAKYGTVLVRGRKIRSKIRLNRKMMAKIQRQIEKDKDESTYGLEHFDQEIAEVQDELEEVVANRRAALEEFENSTKRAITEEIRGRNQPELDRMREDYDITYQQLKDTREQVRQKTLYIAENYEALLGREFVSVTILDKLLEQMEDGQADTIGDALARYKESGNV